MLLIVGALALGSLAVWGAGKARASPDCGGDGRRDNSAVRDAMFWRGQAWVHRAWRRNRLMPVEKQREREEGGYSQDDICGGIVSTAAINC